MKTFMDIPTVKVDKVTFELVPVVDYYEVIGDCWEHSLWHAGWMRVYRPILDAL